ncbi:MAG: MoxR family ATPase [Actinomycetota bacterium]|nr:MoxR family ATPase [Actinomycetota bacterium]
MTSPSFTTIEAARARLESTGYLADDAIATVVYLSGRLGKPLLVEGPAGAGKTELAKSVAAALDLRLLRLQCYEGVDETKVLYEWNYKKQLLRIQAGQGAPWQELSDDIFSEEFLLERPVLQAIRAAEPVVLLIDEVDKLDIEAEALLLEVLSDWQVTIPEMGTVASNSAPFVVLTSNAVRELSEALKRRCLYLYLDYPDLEREKAIVLRRVPGVSETLADGIVRLVRSIRGLELKKPPSIAETLDWARTLLELSITTLSPRGAASAGPQNEEIRRTLSVLVKFQSDIEKVTEHLKIGPRQPGS